MQEERNKRLKTELRNEERKKRTFQKERWERVKEERMQRCQIVKKMKP